MAENNNGRREIASRNTNWANKLARFLTRIGITPNQISVMSVVFAIIGGSMLMITVFYPYFNKYIAYIIYILCIQMRLLCNLFDGMVAIEGGKKTPNGDLYNDIPDRFADVFLIIPVGYVAGGIGVELGWCAAVLAVMTAYFRWIGAYKTHSHFFSGPMAKQHRMALLTGCFAVALCLIHWGYDSVVCLITLIIMNLGLIITLFRRLYFISTIKSQK